MSDSATQVLLLRPEVVVTVIEAGAVLLDLDTKFFYTLNHSGWAILQLFEAGATLDQVQAQCERWSVPAADRAAVTQFLNTVLAENLTAPADLPRVEQDLPLEHPWTPPTIEKAREPLQKIIKSAFDPTLPLAE